jgi:hypothetical protein
MYLSLFNFSFVDIFNLHHSPKVAGEHPDTKQGHYLCRLPHSDVLLSAFCRVWGLPPGCNGLWPLWPSVPRVLHCHHEAPVLWVAGVCVLDHKCPGFLVTKLCGVVAILLHRSENSTLVLWT